MIAGIVDSHCPIPPEAKEIIPHIVKVESNANPFAIGVVGGQLERQPKNLEEAIATANSLEESGRNYSVGLAQVNRANFKPYGIASIDQAFDSCRNLAVAADILLGCHKRAGSDWPKALSCYYSGNFVTGFEHGYVRRVITGMPLELRTRMLASNSGRWSSSFKVNDERDLSEHRSGNADGMKQIDRDTKQTGLKGKSARHVEETELTQPIDDASFDQMMRNSNELMKRIKKHASENQGNSTETIYSAPPPHDPQKPMQGGTDGAFVF